MAECKDDEEAAEEARGEGGRIGKGYADSASVSVSVSSPGGLLSDAGFPLLLNTRTISNPSFSSAKWTFLPAGVDGALWARECFGMASCGMLGEETEDLSEDLRGLPFERMIGVLGVRGSEIEVEDVTKEGVGAKEETSGGW